MTDTRPEPPTPGEAAYAALGVGAGRAPRWLGVACLAVIAVQAALLLRFIVTVRPDRPAYEVRMTIDAYTYVKRAVAMVAAGDTFYTPDQRHSVGMQVLTAQVFRLFRSQTVAVKILNWVLWLAILWLAWRAYAIAFPSTSAAWIGTTMIALSIPLQRYCAIVQYEVFVCAALTLLLWLNVSDDRPRAAAISGAIAAILAIFRVHFAALLPALAAVYFLYPSARPLRRHLALALGFVAIALPWNAYYGARIGAPFFFQNGVDRQVLRWLNPNAPGYNYPYPKVVEPSGMRFITERPYDYLKLLAERVTYLTGIERDIWWVEPRGARILSTVMRPGRARRVAAATSALVALAGALLVLHPRTRTRAGVVAIALIAVLLAPHFVMSSSTRFLVPAIPLVVLLQMQLALRVAGFMPRGARPGAAAP